MSLCPCGVPAACPMACSASTISRRLNRQQLLRDHRLGPLVHAASPVAERSSSGSPWAQLSRRFTDQSKIGRDEHERAMSCGYAGRERSSRMACREVGKGANLEHPFKNDANPFFGSQECSGSGTWQFLSS
jgi:hypothetical protein